MHCPLRAHIYVCRPGCFSICEQMSSGMCKQLPCCMCKHMRNVLHNQVAGFMCKQMRILLGKQVRECMCKRRREGERRRCMKTKVMMLREPALLKALLEHLTEGLTRYVIHQIDCGAQVAPVSPVVPRPQ